MPTDHKRYWKKAAKKQSHSYVISKAPRKQHSEALAKPKLKDSSSKYNAQNAENLHNSNMLLVKMLSTSFHPQLKNW